MYAFDELEYTNIEILPLIQEIIKMKKTSKKIKVIHSDVIINEGDKKETLVLPEDKEIILEEEHEVKDGET